MTLLSRQHGPIALYGATGYTGRLVAHELASADADFVLSGRNRAKLEAVCEELGRIAPVQPASLDDPQSLRDLLDSCAAVINCAGPFALHGEPVLEAAVETKTHYLDTTGEQLYMRKVFEEYGPRAEERGVALLSAMGMDYVPGDMIASITADGLEEVEELTLAYAVRGFGATRGTLQTALLGMAGNDVEFRDGELRPAPQSWGRGKFEFPEPIGKRRVLRYPAGEQITVPRHVPTRNVRTVLTADMVVPHRRLDFLAPALSRPAGLAMRTPLRRAAEAMISRAPEGPSAGERRAATWTIVCDVRSDGAERRGMIRGRDPYGLTAAAIVHGARGVTRRGFRGGGALAPSQAFDPVDFLDSLGRFDVDWEVTEGAGRESESAPSAAE